MARKKDKIAQLRKIVEEKQYGKVDGQKVDLFTASAILTIYDSLNEENRERYQEMGIPQMADIAFRLLKKNPTPSRYENPEPVTESELTRRLKF